MGKSIKQIIGSLPLFGDFMRRLYWRMIASKGKHMAGLSFIRSSDYWEERYAKGGNSGAGSYGPLAEFKAEVLNRFVADHAISSVIEFGSGDGNQLKLAQYPHYIGVDVSENAILLCKQTFPADSSKCFLHTSEYHGRKADLSISLDVIYHLVEDKTYEAYMKTLFDAAHRYVIIFSSNTNDNLGVPAHVRHRMFTGWVSDKPKWELIQHVPNKYPYKGDNTKGSFADFYIFERVTTS